MNILNVVIDSNFHNVSAGARTHTCCWVWELCARVFARAVFNPVLERIKAVYSPPTPPSDPAAALRNQTSF